MTLAERIVMALDAYGDRYADLREHPDLDALVEMARGRYSALKRQNDFSTSSYKARVELVEALIQREADVQ